MTGFSGSPRKIFDHLICNYKNSKFTYEIVRENVFSHSQSKYNFVLHENSEFKVKNLVRKREKQE